MPAIIRLRVGIAVSEVAANIIKHATKGLERLVQLHVWANVRDNDVTIVFADDGIPVDTAHFGPMGSAAMPDEAAESGRGIPLAHAGLSELGYRRTGERNHWTLVSEAF